MWHVHLLDRLRLDVFGHRSKLQGELQTSPVRWGYEALPRLCSGMPGKASVCDFDESDVRLLGFGFFVRLLVAEVKQRLEEGTM